MPTPETAVPSSGPVTAREILIVILACLALTVLFGLPWYPNTRTIPTTYQGGNEYFAHLDAGIWTFMLSWGARHPDRFYDAPVLIPLAHPLVANDPRLTEGIWSIPLFRALPPVLAWGACLYLALFTAALSSYFAGRYLTGSRWGGAAVAVFFAFGNFRAVHICHIEGLFAPFLPAALASMAVFFDRPTLRRAAWFLLFAVLAVIEYSYTAVPLALGLPPAILWGAWRRGLPIGRALLGILAAFACIALILAPVGVTYYDFHRATGLERFSYEQDLLSPGFRAWLTSPNNQLLAPFGGSGETTPDLLLFPGFVLCLLGFWGLRRFWRRSPEIAIVGLISLFLSFGTWRALLWQLGLPYWPLPTPYELLADLFLPLRAIRAPGRLAVVAFFAFSVAAAIAAVRLAERSRRGRLLTVLLLLVSFWEARHAVHAIDLLPERIGDPAFRWLASSPESGAVLDAPMGQHLVRKDDQHEVDSLFSFLIHGRPTPNGTIATFIPWHETLAVHLARPRPHETLSILRQLGVRFVYTPDSASATSWIAAGLRPVHYSDSGSLVLIVDSGVCPVPAAPRELQDRLFPLFMEHGAGRDSVSALAGSLHITNPAVASPGRSTTFVVTVRNDGRDTWCASGALFGFGVNRDVLVAIRRWQRVDQPNAPVRDMRGEPLHAIAFLPCDLAPGETAVCTLRALAPPRSGDYRVYIDLYQGDKGWIHERDSAVILPIRVLP